MNNKPIDEPFAYEKMEQDKLCSFYKNYKIIKITFYSCIRAQFQNSICYQLIPHQNYVGTQTDIN